jgi:hypothetical protein
MAQRLEISFLAKSPTVGHGKTTNGNLLLHLNTVGFNQCLRSLLFRDEERQTYYNQTGPNNRFIGHFVARQPIPGRGTRDRA